MYRILKRLRIVEKGGMENVEYALSVFRSHYNREKLLPGFTCLELGPGDSLVSALIGHAHGAGRIYLVDVENAVTQDIDHYINMANRLAALGLNVPLHFSSIDEMLRLCNAEYATHGLASLQTLQSQTVDFIWSQAVLEHVWRDDFAALNVECGRLLRDTGYASHYVDLQDHLSHALNNLRFTSRIWESNLFRMSGFYTNRIRFGEMLEIFRQAGFRCVVDSRHTWESLPTPRNKMQAEFNSLPEEDLLVAGFNVTLSREPKAAANRPC